MTRVPDPGVPEGPPSTTAPTLLRGWKDIGRYLAVSPRSAQRWAAESGMPVYRSQSGGSVVAYAKELEAWQKCLAGEQTVTEGAEAGLPAVDTPEPSVPTGPVVARHSTSSGSFRWHRSVPLAAAVLILATWWGWTLRTRPGHGFLGTDAGSAVAGKSPEDASSPARRARTVTLGVRTPHGTIRQLSVSEGSRARIDAGGDLSLELEPTLRDGRLRLAVYDLARRPSANGRRSPSGLLELAAPDPAGLNHLRLQFAQTWIEVHWVALAS